MVPAHDCGQPINPLAVEQQIQRSAMEAGPQGVLMEKHDWTSRGQNLNANFLDYWFSAFHRRANIDPIVVSSNDPFGPFGAKEGGLVHLRGDDRSGGQCRAECHRRACPKSSLSHLKWCWRLLEERKS